MPLKQMMRAGFHLLFLSSCSSWAIPGWMIVVFRSSFLELGIPPVDSTSRAAGCLVPVVHSFEYILIIAVCSGVQSLDALLCTRAYCTANVLLLCLTVNRWLMTGGDDCDFRAI